MQSFEGWQMKGWWSLEEALAVVLWVSGVGGRELPHKANIIGRLDLVTSFWKDSNY